MTELEKEFVLYPEALELKELGFDEPCFGYFIELRNPNEGILTIDKCENNIDGVLAPTFSQAFRFFREKYGLDYQIPYAGKPKEYHAFVKDYVYGNNRNNPSVFSYEEAELVCLKKLIEIVKK